MSGPQREAALGELRIRSASGVALREDRMARAKTLDVDGPSAPRQAGIVWFAELAGNTWACLRLGVARIKRLKHIDGDSRAMRSSVEAASSAGLMLRAHQRDLALRSALLFGSDLWTCDSFPSLMLAPRDVTRQESLEDPSSAVFEA